MGSPPVPTVVARAGRPRALLSKLKSTENLRLTSGAWAWASLAPLLTRSAPFGAQRGAMNTPYVPGTVAFVTSSGDPGLGSEEQPQYPRRLPSQVAPAGDRLGGEQDGVALLQGVGVLAELQLQRALQ
jgi:hypothetical protein